MDLVLSIGIMLLAGLLAGTVAARLRFPRITGYLLVGVLLNPSLLPLLPRTVLESSDTIASIVLGVISYLIGGGLRMDSVRRLGKAIAWITLFQSVTPWLLSAMLIVFIGPLVVMGIPDASLIDTFFPMGLVLGAIACSSAPAAILAIMNECKARGPLTTTSLAVLALTDVAAVIAFAVALGISQPMAIGGGASLYGMFVPPLLHMGESLILGSLFGLALLLLSKVVKERTLLLAAVLGMILLCIEVAEFRHASPFLANMVAGFIVVNKAGRDEMVHVIEEIVEVLFIVFFVLNGMHFDLAALESAGGLTVLVILGRWGGKYLGARTGARIAGAQDSVRLYPGLVLLPKAGLTLGFAFAAKAAFPSFGDLMFDALLASTLINMLVTPPIAKYAISKAGERYA
jgi:Kef-type K+ transport system membrane component KefB